jgi:hypothetical protein
MQQAGSPSEARGPRKRSSGGHRRLALRLVAGCAAAIALYALVGFFLVPYLGERHTGSWLGDRLGVQLRIGEVRFNPFLLRLSAEHLQLVTEDAAQPLFSAEAAVADLDWRSAWRSGWRFSTLTLDAPHAYLHIGPDGRFNWATLGSGPSDSSQQAPQWRFGQVRVESGRISYVDQRHDAPVAAQLDDIEMAISDLSSLRQEDSPPAHYVVSAALEGGGKLHGEGSLALQPQMQSSGEVRLVDIELPKLWPLLRRNLDLDIEPLAERLGVSARYRVAAGSDAPELQIDRAEFRLDQFALQPATGEGALLRLDTLSGSGGRLQLAARELHLATLRLQGGEMSLAVNAQGAVDLGPLTTSAASRPSDEPPARARWQLHVETLRVDDLALHVAGRSRQPALALDVAAWTGSAGLRVAWGGGPLQLALSAVETRLERARLTRVDEDATDGPSGAPHIAFGSLSVSGGALNVGQRRIEAGRIDVEGGRVALELGGEEPLSLLQALRVEPQGAASASTAVPAAAPAGNEAWHYAVGRVSLEGLALDIRHSGYDPPVAYQAELTQAALQHIDSAADAPMELQAQMNLGEGAEAAISGSVAQNAASGRGALHMDGLPLTPLQPMLARYVRLQLRDGRLSASLQLDLRRSGSGLDLRATGEADVTSLRLEETGSDERLLSWRALHASGIDLSTGSRLLRVAEVVVRQPGAKLLIERDRQVNLAQLLRDETPAGYPGAQAASTGRRQPLADESSDFDAVVERLRIEDGVLDFADLSLVLPFRTQITQLSGGVVNISTRGGARARVEASGQIGSFGSARFSGSLLPFAPKRYLNIQAAMENVLIPPFSPYTATFAGRKVDEGRLWLDLDYRVEDRELLGRNSIRLSDFQLGERVEAPRAIDAQLDMLVALLKDEDGNIELSIPVSGDLDKSGVDFGALLREAAGKLFRRIVSAPFRALASLFGGNDDADRLARIEFAPGNDALAPPQREKLQAVGRALTRRPQLRLVVDGPYAPAVDAPALRRRAARDELARAVGSTAAAGEAAGPIAYESGSTQAALDAMYARYVGASAPSAPPAERAAFAAAPSGKAGATGSYPAMFERIAERYPLPAAALQLLAARRAQAIRGYLVSEAGVPAGRVRTGMLDALDDSEREAISATLELVPQAADNAAGARADAGG